MSDIRSDDMRRVFGMPQTHPGRLAVFLCVLFFALFGAWFAYVEMQPMHRPTFFSDPIHAVLLLSAAVSAILGGLLGAFVLLMRRDRSILTIMSVIVGAVVLYWTIAEIIGE